jgi:hypothetical protein
MALFRYKIGGSSHTQGPSNFGLRHQKDKNSTHNPFLHKKNSTYPHHYNCFMPAYLPPHNRAHRMYIRYDLLFNICGEKKRMGQIINPTPVALLGLTT